MIRQVNLLSRKANHFLWSMVEMVPSVMMRYSNLIPSAEEKMAYTQTKMEDITTNKDTEDKPEGDFDIENSIFRGICPICSENVPIDCVFLDCGHNIYCWKCGQDEFARRIIPNSTFT